MNKTYSEETISSVIEQVHTILYVVLYVMQHSNYVPSIT